MNNKRQGGYTVISILNYDEYQKSEQQVEQQMNNTCTTDEQQMNTNKNDKNIIIYYIYNKYLQLFKNCKTFSEKIKIQRDLMNDEDYKKLTDEQQEKIFKELI